MHTSRNLTVIAQLDFRTPTQNRRQRWWWQTRNGDSSITT